MTLYARSDVQTVAVSPDLGCGKAHTRPNRKDGTPVRTWELDCARCETQLEDDAQWSKSRYNVPLTAEEQAELEDLNKRAESIAATERIAAAREVARTVVEKQQGPDDYDPDDEPVDDEDAGEGEHEDDGGEDDSGGGGQSDDLDDLSRKDLNALARDAGLNIKGTRDEVIARLRQHRAAQEKRE